MGIAAAGDCAGACAAAGYVNSAAAAAKDPFTTRNAGFEEQRRKLRG